MRLERLHARCSARWLLAAASALAAPLTAPGQVPAAGDFTYYAKPRDTLIGLSRRILLQPRLWHEIQARNHIADPYRIRPGTPINIPYPWLRLSAEQASVSKVTGTVLSAGQAVGAGQTLAQGSLIETGADGSVAIELADGSRITLQKSSALRLQEMQRVEGVSGAHDIRLQLASGHAETNVKPHRDVGRFEIVTPVAVSAVRGTTFRANFLEADRSATTETLVGTVAVAGQSGAVDVPEGFGTRIEKESAPLQPVPLLAAPELSSLPDTNSLPSLRIALAPLAGARAYRAQISTDQDFRTLLSDVESRDSTLTIPGLADGSYWLRVRGIDQFGLEGRDAVRAWRQHSLPEPPAPSAPSAQARVIGTQTRFEWSAASPGSTYRLQLARAADFSQLVSDQTGIAALQTSLDGLPAGQYFWRVASMNAAGEAGRWSAVQSFTQRPAPPTPALAGVGAHDVRFDWQATPGEKYRVQIARDLAFKHIMTEQLVDGGQCSWKRPWPGKYYIRLQPLSADGADPAGEPQAFDVPVPRWVRYTLPLVMVIPLLF